MQHFKRNNYIRIPQLPLLAHRQHRAFAQQHRLFLRRLGHAGIHAVQHKISRCDGVGLGQQNNERARSKTASSAA